MNVLDLTKEELLAIDNCEPTEVFNAFVIVPTGKLHDSGFQMMKFILCDGYHIVGAVSGYSDVVHLDGIGGYGLNYKNTMLTKTTHVVGWKMDCLPKSGCMRLFTNRGNNLKLQSFISSDFEIYVEDKK